MENYLTDKSIRALEKDRTDTQVTVTLISDKKWKVSLAASYFMFSVFLGNFFIFIV